ncbi:hypothetical protein ACO2Q8_25460 [Larkinella sp. VNQ87]|uniref:hypothetical protein n=1 Tax=Larkinella sp. VNQ87 TaxID=3400921 RepID=UPI003C01956F
MKTILYYLLFTYLLVLFNQRNDYLSLYNYSLISTATCDTITEIITLQYRFDYIKGDSAKSAILLKEQELFLKKMGLPHSGISSLYSNKRFEQDLDINYIQTVEKLKNHKYKNLYRQVCSQVLVKYYCENKSTNAEKIEYYLNEFTETGGINIGLIYIALLKIKNFAHSIDLCEYLNKNISYCSDLIKEQESDFKNTSEQVTVHTNETSKDIDFLMDYVRNRDKLYFEKINKLKLDSNCTN